MRDFKDSCSWFNKIVMRGEEKWKRILAFHASFWFDSFPSQQRIEWEKEKQEYQYQIQTKPSAVLQRAFELRQISWIVFTIFRGSFILLPYQFILLLSKLKESDSSFFRFSLLPFETVATRHRNNLPLSLVHSIFPFYFVDTYLQLYLSFSLSLSLFNAGYRESSIIVIVIEVWRSR